MSEDTTIRLNADFGKNVQTIADKLGARVDLVAKKIVGELFGRIIERTPVDTGRLRANWNLSVDTPNTATNMPGGTSIDFAKSMKNRVEAMDIAGHQVYLSNGLPYAAVVEYGGYPNPPKYGSKKRGEDGMAIHVINGYSMQAPHGMVRVSIAEIENIVQEAVK